jgi:NAD(P)-dependent dehydrogenase (short-subunit alcohol dehydrogenase family)
MPRKIKDSVVVMTGASSGIGRAAALMFAERGASVVLAARREGALREVAGQCTHLGGRSLVVPTDVANERAVFDLARRAVDHFGRIDVWVNNAAVLLMGRFEEVPTEAFRRVIDTNLFGYIYGARAALPYFRRQGGGVLINNASIVGKTGQAYAIPYAISKFGVRGLSESLRQELSLDRASGISVCTLLPASIDTPIYQHAGNYTGRVLRPLNPIYEAEKVALAMVHCAKKPKREVIVGRSGRVMALLHAATPRRLEKIMARQVKYNQFQDQPAPATSGNLFEPVPAWSSIGGGWKVTGRPKMKYAALAAAIPALLAWRFRSAITRTGPEGIKEDLKTGRLLKSAAKLLGLTASRSLLRRLG